MIQQPDSPLTSDHSDNKYRKALAEIHKIHNANRALKAETESIKVQSEQRVREIAQSLQQMQQRSQNAEKEILRLREETSRQEKLLQEMKSSCINLKQQKSKLLQEIAFLTATITEQGIELKRLSALKADKNASLLIASYEKRELSYRSQIAHQLELIASLQNSEKGVEEELKSERRKIWQLSESNSALRAEVQNYKKVNANLVERSENLLSTAKNERKAGEKEKYLQAEVILSEMGRQLDLIRSCRAQKQEQSSPAQKMYDKLVLENHQLSEELQKARGMLRVIEERANESLQLQERLKLTNLKMQYMEEECNSLKRKLVVLETSQCINEEGEEWLKNIRSDSNEGKFGMTNIAKSPDISHFHLMKTYIIESKRRLSQALLDKKQLQIKYRAVKEKLADRAQRTLQLEEQQKLLTTKLEGFQRLTERLQIQLERSLHANQEEIAQIKASAQEEYEKQAQQAKSRTAQVQIQLQMQYERYLRNEEELRVEVSALEQQLSNEKSRGRDIQFQLEQVNEFLAIYKDKFQQLQTHNQELQEMHTVLSENALRFEQLYREERTKNDVIAAQKQSLTAKLSRVNDQMDRHQQEESQTKQREAAYEYQLAKLRNQLQQAKSEATQLHNNLRAASNQIEESRLTISGAARSQGGYHSSLRQNYQKERQKNKLLESELVAVKQKLDQTILQAQRAASLEDALSAKSQELSDIKRRTAGFDKEVGFLELEIRRIRSEYENLKKENGVLKDRLIEGGQELRKGVAAREAEGEKEFQRMSEELVASNSQLRQQKRRTVRLQLELQAISGQLRRSEQLLEQARRKEKALTQQLITLRSAYESTCQENTRIRSQIHFQKDIQQGLKNDLQAAQGRINQSKEQNSELSLKIQSNELGISDLKRQIGGLKIYLPEIESMAATKCNSGWQEQREKQNLTNFLQRIKKLLKYAHNSDIIEEIRPEQYSYQAISPSKPSSSKPEYFKYQVFEAEAARSVASEPFFVEGDHEEVPSQYHDYLQ